MQVVEDDSFENLLDINCLNFKSSPISKKMIFWVLYSHIIRVYFTSMRGFVRKMSIITLAILLLVFKEFKLNPIEESPHVAL